MHVCVHALYMCVCVCQPGSTASAPASTTSSQSGRSKTRQYHTVSFTSHVDETLFGSSPVLTNHKTPHCCVGRLPIETEASQRKCKGKGNGRCKGKREVYQHITRDLIRNIMSVLPPHRRLLTFVCLFCDREDVWVLG